MPEFCWTPEVTHPNPHFSLWRERRCFASKTQGLPSVAWTVCCLASPSLVPPTPPGGQTWETGMVPTGEETSGPVLRSMAALGKQHSWGLKTEMCVPRVWQAVLSQRPLPASSVPWRLLVCGLIPPTSASIVTWPLPVCVCVLAS